MAYLQQRNEHDTPVSWTAPAPEAQGPALHWPARLATHECQWCDCLDVHLGLLHIHTASFRGTFGRGLVLDCRSTMVQPRPNFPELWGWSQAAAVRIFTRLEKQKCPWPQAMHDYSLWDACKLWLALVAARSSALWCKLWGADWEGVEEEGVG